VIYRGDDEFARVHVGVLMRGDLMIVVERLRLASDHGSYARTVRTGKFECWPVKAGLRHASFSYDDVVVR
jgi:hypothetical protein